MELSWIYVGLRAISELDSLRKKIEPCLVANRAIPELDSLSGGVEAARVVRVRALGHPPLRPRHWYELVMSGKSKLSLP